MRLTKISLKDKRLFNRFLGASSRGLAVYAFENIFIWKELFDIRWVVIEDSLCVFFRDKIGCFLYLPPLGSNKGPGAVEEVFKIMDSFNRNKEISRIENIEEEDISFYQGLGLDCRIKSYDYLCGREDLTDLGGNRFKSKRSSFNYFIKHNKFEYLPFSLRHKEDCFKLYDCWRGKRKANNPDPLSCGMLDDAAICLAALLKNYRKLDITGRLVKIGQNLKAFTFGYELNPDTFCVLYEVADLSVKGLAQFIFRSFCQELKDYKYINIMDDSGLENLKKVKLSYHPVKLVPAYIAKKKDE
ncbi:MAG: phosphatidylglycerol lysyltransferase domain-containing protein [Candidatus Omnitrophota bacterium]